MMRPFTMIPGLRFPVLALLLALGIAACGEDTPADLLVPKPDTTAAEGTTGASLYRYHCSSCHGNDGRPLVSSSEDLRDYHESFQTFDSILVDGPGLMPRFDHLTEAKRRLIYDHTVSLRR